MHRWLGALALVTPFVASACASDVTELVVVVDSDMAVPSRIDGVTITVTGDQARSFTSPLSGADAASLPLVLGVVPSGDESAAVSVSAAATLAGAEVVRQETRTRFVQGEIRVVRLFLVGSCAGQGCPEAQTCDVTGCRAIDVPPSSLPAWPGHPPRLDGGVDGCMPQAETCNGMDDDCDGVSDDGFDLQTDPLHCGSCENACPAGAGGAATCVGGICNVACDPGLHACDGRCVDDASPQTCGASCAPCDPGMHAAATCDGTSCGVVCDPGWGNCDGDLSNGCETDLATSTDCDACMMRCEGATPICVGSAGSAVCAADCAAPRMQCGDLCVDTSTDPRHCGRCGNGCTEPSHGAAACSGGTCGATCDPGFHDCAGSCVDSTAVETCGTRCAPCPDPPGAIGTCTMAACDLTCMTGRGNCDSDPASGCETDVLTTVAHCGSCGAPCAPPDAMPACTGGMCTVAGCTGGHDDCDGDPVNGCEADLATSAMHCGACRRACAAGYACNAGVCADTLVQITGGIDHTCVLLAGGEVWCWGDNTYGELGGGVPPMPSDHAIRAGGITDAVEVTAGEGFTCARRRSGQVVCWGLDDRGQLGDGRSGMGVVSTTPVDVAMLGNATAIDAGYAHACAVRTGASVVCWGQNDAGQIGDGTAGNLRTRFAAVMGLSDAVEVDAGSVHTCARRMTGGIVCWGANGNGELGTGDTMSHSTPVAVTVGAATRVTAGIEHTCVLLAAGGGTCFGLNDFGQLGDGRPMATAMRSLVPVPIVGLTGTFTDLDTAERTTCALASTGTVRCWGPGDRGQLGNGDRVTSFQPMPVTVLDLSDARQISVSFGSACALRATGDVVCWGENDSGEIGRPGADSTTPVPVAGLP